MRRSESEFQRSVVAGVRRLRPGWWVFHPPNGGRRGAREAARLVGEGVLPGTPDVVCLMPGGRVGTLELKTAKGRLSPAQVRYREWAREAGLPHYVVRTMEDVLDAVRMFDRAEGSSPPGAG